MKRDKLYIKNFSLDELKSYLVENGEQKFRAKQIFNWMFYHFVDRFDEMENLPKSLREKLDDELSLFSLEVSEKQISKSTGTKKLLFTTHDDRNIEAVIIPEGERNTLCISTQVGCPLDCKFCATGLMGFKRNLNVAEIVDQYILASKEAGDTPITNIVYMGMGEPLLNFENTIKSLELFTNEINTGISRNRITLSTSGIPHKIVELAESGLRVKLALSLHSPFEDIRSQIMPINKKYPLADTMAAVKKYTRLTKTRVTFEYVMLQNINDRDEDIRALRKLCSQVPSKINIIPFNSIAHMVPDGFSASLVPTTREKISQFADKLKESNITVMLRETQGDDIAAACGQLANK